MNDEIAQLLKSLHLTKIAEILDEEIAKAEKKDASYQELLALLLRAQWHHRQETAPDRDPRPAQSSRAGVGHSS